MWLGNIITIWIQYTDSKVCEICPRKKGKTKYQSKTTQNAIILHYCVCNWPIWSMQIMYTDSPVTHGMILDDFPMLTIDSTTSDNLVSTLDTGTNNSENDTEAHKNIYCGQVERVFGLFGNFVDTHSITVNINGPNCPVHKSCVEGKLLSNCDS